MIHLFTLKQPSSENNKETKHKDHAHTYWMICQRWNPQMNLKNLCEYGPRRCSGCKWPAAAPLPTFVLLFRLLEESGEQWKLKIETVGDC